MTVCGLELSPCPRVCVICGWWEEFRHARQSRSTHQLEQYAQATDRASECQAINNCARSYEGERSFLYSVKPSQMRWCCSVCCSSFKKRRSDAMYTFTGLLLVLAVSFCFASSQEGDNRPNFVIYLVDGKWLVKRERDPRRKNGYWKFICQNRATRIHFERKDIL